MKTNPDKLNELDVHFGTGLESSVVITASNDEGTDDACTDKHRDDGSCTDKRGDGGACTDKHRDDRSCTDKRG